MAIDLNYYESKVVCNICKKQYTTYKVRPGRYKILSQDTDFMPIYDGLNPLLYEVSVCPHCGYAYHKSLTRTYGPFLELIKESYIKRIKKVRNLCNERTIEDAITSFQLAYLVAKFSMEEPIVLANFALKIAWLCRLKKDLKAEMRYLRSARELFYKSQTSDKESEERMQYLVAEISLRLGDIEEAKRGFSRLITGKDVSNKYRNYAKKRWEDYKYDNEKTVNEES